MSQTLDDLTVASYSLVESEVSDVTLERVRGIDCIRWAIRRGKTCFNKSGDWEYEPLPSSRTEEFFARCRWDTPEEALACWTEKANRDCQENAVRLVREAYRRAREKEQSG
jgi:hypothetical protein